MKRIALLCVIVLILSLFCSCAGGSNPAESDEVTHGWVETEGVRRYYVDGNPLTGQQEIDGTVYYFSESGILRSGWVDESGKRYYFGTNGAPLTGWQDIDGKRFYFTEDGSMHIGWLDQDGGRYYLKEDGSMARGQITIDGVNRFFTSGGLMIHLVNPQNYIPEDYEPDLVKINDTDLAYAELKVDRSCYDALIQMMTDCNKLSGARVYVVSAYRTMARQTQNYNNKVAYWKERGYSDEGAKKKAATSVAVPGTSEHQLGLALDIVDTRSWTLDGAQDSFEGQQWLMEHCWEYGFILRYPKDKLDITGIIYEPWHYRYVGKELAAELRGTGLTLEEYFAELS